MLLGELHGTTLAGLDAGTPAITCSARWGCDILDDPSPITGAVPAFYKEVDNRYVLPTGSVDFIRVVGTNPAIEVEIGFSSSRHPIKEQIVTQQGVTFSRATTDFNEFAQPEAVTSSSAGMSDMPGGATGFLRTESTTYRHDKVKWVIGQVLKSYVGGTEVSWIVYDDSLDLPSETYSFGLLQQRLTYNSEGTIATVADGAGHVTQLSIWKRGVPSQIRLPDTTAGMALISAQINNLGNLDWTRDVYEKVTTYEYDLMGRLKKLSYPNETALTWNPLNRKFELEALQDEYGIPPGHWRQTVDTGTGKTTTFYDARWNPVLTLTEDTANAASRSFVVRRFDGMGREVFSSYPVSAATVNDVLYGVTTEYDALGRSYRTKQDSELPNGGVLVSTTQYLPGFKTRVTNPRGYSSVTSYKAFGEPTTDMPVRIDALEGAQTVRTEIARDDFGKPTEITRSGPGG